VFRQLDEIVGFRYLKGMHINESKKALNSHVDRHDSLGDGLIGSQLFDMLMNDPRMEELPLILETPDETRWAREIEYLYGLIRG